MADSNPEVVNLGTIIKCTMLLIVVTSPCLSAEGKKCVRGLTYFDPVTGHCDRCSEICDFAKEQGTEDRCEKLCHGYKPRVAPTPCLPNQFYDKVVSRCEPCDSVCLHPRSGDACRTLCPNWTNVYSSSTASSPDPQNIPAAGNSSAMASLGKNDGDTGGKKMTIAVYALVGIVAICCFVAVVLFRKSWIGMIHNLTSRGKCNKRPYQEEGPGDSTLSLPLYSPGRGPVCPPVEEQQWVTVL